MNVASRLTRAQLRDLKGALRSELARVERSIASRRGADDLAVPTGTVYQGNAQTDSGLAVALETRVFDRREMLDDALRRLEEGTYGVCMSCRSPIPYGRLLVMPEATYCVSCGAVA